jgi:hypothetical protein
LDAVAAEVAEVSEEPTVDPRYAAQFQRGYDGPVLAQPPATTTHSTRTAPVRIEGGPPSKAARVPAPPPVVVRPDSDEEPVDVDEPASPGIPWFEWSLLALGVALVVAAAVLFWQSATDMRAYVGSSSPDEQLLMRVRGTLPGPLFVAGIVASSLGVILRAVRPRQ